MIRKVANRLNLDLTYYVSGGALLAVDEAAIMVLGLATTWCFSAYASKGVYGSYGYISAMVAMLGLITLPGLSQAIQRSSARDFDGAYFDGMKQRLCAGAVGSAIMVVVAFVLYFSHLGHLAKGALVAAAIFPFSGTLDDYRSVLFGKQRLSLYVALHAGIQACVSSATILAILAGVTFPAILLANLTTRALGNGVSILVMRGYVLQNRRVDPEFRRFGWHLSAIGVVGGVSYHLDRVIVGAMLGLETMAAYELTFRLTEPIRALGVFLNRLVFPRAVRVSGAAVARRFLTRMGLIAAGLFALGVVGTWAIGPLVRLIFPRYPEAIQLIRWMMWSSLFAVPLIYLETYYLTQERFLPTYYVSATVRPALIIALLPYLTYRYGALGAIWTKFAVRGLQALILYIKLLFDWRMLEREKSLAALGGAALGPLEFVRCPLCGEAAADPRWTVNDRRGGRPGRFVVARCRSCGALRAYPQLTATARERYALDAPEASIAFPPPAPRAAGAPRRRAWLAWLAAGRPTARETGWRAWLTSLPARWRPRRHVAANLFSFPAEGRRLLLSGGAAEAQQAALATWGWAVERESRDRAAGPFDAIGLVGRLERVDDPLAELRRARARLAAGGLLAVAAPLADGLLPRLTGHCWTGLDQPRQLTLFTRARLTNALRATGFRVVAVVPCSTAAAWRESLAALAAEGSLTGWGIRLLRSRWAAAPLAGLAWLADLIGRGDEAMVLAIRDDAPAAGWAPRESREQRVR